MEKNTLITPWIFEPMDNYCVPSLEMLCQAVSATTRTPFVHLSAFSFIFSHWKAALLGVAVCFESLSIYAVKHCLIKFGWTWAESPLRFRIHPAAFISSQLAVWILILDPYRAITVNGLWNETHYIICKTWWRQCHKMEKQNIKEDTVHVDLTHWVPVMLNPIL